MADNRLKKSPDVTGEEFLAEIYGSKSRPEWRAPTTLSGEILTGRSTLVGDLSLPLREGPGALVGEARIRFIGGRPRKRTVDDGQMRFEGF